MVMFVSSLSVEWLCLSGYDFKKLIPYFFSFGFSETYLSPGVICLSFIL